LDAVRGYSPAGRDRVGLAARIVAATVIGKVVDGHSGLDSLLDEKSGLAAWRALIAKDRALCRAIAAAALRRRREIDAALSSLVHRPPPKNARHLLHTLHAAAAQILYLDVPDSAAVNLAVAAISEDRRSARFAGFANALLRRLSNEKPKFQADLETAEARLPGWLAQALIRDHGQAAADAIAAMVACEPVLDLTLRPDLGKDEQLRIAEALDAQVLPTGSLRVSDSRPVAQLPGFGEGKWWVQDTASSLPARLLGPVSGKAIADLCAAPGGKTAQLAAAGAMVTAVDVSAARLERLKANLDRLSLSAECITGDVLAMTRPAAFDAVLLDAPCSATGTVRRHPDVLWAKTPRDVATLAILQERLILAAARWLKPGGVLVYANCSMLKAEGEEVVARVLAAGARLQRAPLAARPAGFEAAWFNEHGDLRTLPHHLGAEPRCAGGMDGFFACRLTVN
jgi:16S rRNA (cytosine967-C5)-methyltransferase